MERRKHKRSKIKVMIDYLNGSDIEVGYTKDISLGGMFIETTNIPEKDSVVFVDFYLPGVRKKLKLKGRVVWSSNGSGQSYSTRPGIGIEFMDLSDENKNNLNIGIKNIRGDYENK
ncbi:MAG: PilZ domain-containing protein [bacterium]